MAVPSRRIAGIVSSSIADFAAHPGVQFGVLLGCVAWLAIGGSVNALASTLTIGGFILTQMVLNQQRGRERALHLKIDELILAAGGARNELAGVEQHSEEDLERLRSEGAGRDPAQHQPADGGDERDDEHAGASAKTSISPSVR